MHRLLPMARSALAPPFLYVPCALKKKKRKMFKERKLHIIGDTNPSPSNVQVLVLVSGIKKKTVCFRGKKKKAMKINGSTLRGHLDTFLVLPSKPRECQVGPIEILKHDFALKEKNNTCFACTSANGVPNGKRGM
eukprot:TRINITY_DN13692_c0_g1_i1.p2 TRINITY_DN13692_c0_g1~~TRINITY_DN13692_c0_g1_i1.p2  ORF type:complete len:135 (-),score=2.26 TRINITY_DN13692_c0_g1_i1:371-775(-)